MPHHAANIDVVPSFWIEVDLDMDIDVGEDAHVG